MLGTVMSMLIAATAAPMGVTSKQTITITVSVRPTVKVRRDPKGVAISMNSTKPFSTRREGRVLIIVPE